MVSQADTIIDDSRLFLDDDTYRSVQPQTCEAKLEILEIGSRISIICLYLFAGKYPSHGD
ncbi:MAG TPA: hypothetical protein VMF10_15490 [Candidatus Aquilonibacter sp.]|nr:hypothetical protein [Candidatus Aquilonibacter sp.]